MYMPMKAISRRFLQNLTFERQLGTMVTLGILLMTFILFSPNLEGGYDSCFQNSCHSSSSVGEDLTVRAGLAADFAGAA